MITSAGTTSAKDSDEALAGGRPGPDAFKFPGTVTVTRLVKAAGGTGRALLARKSSS
jgi:hypothetical protein